MGCGSSISRDVLSLSHCRVNDNTKNVHVEKCNNAKLRVDDNIVFVFGEYTALIIAVMVTSIYRRSRLW